MKYKMIGICAVLLAIVAAFVISFTMPEDNGLRYIQHRDAPPKADCAAHTSGEFCTHLPIVKIDTAGLEIPGQRIEDPHTRDLIGYTLAADGSTTILASLETIDRSESRNHPSDPANLSSQIMIRLRGNSSRTFQKPNYQLTLVNPDGTNNAQPLLGMDPHHDWALHGPILDQSLIRNYLWYNIAGEIMDYSPNVRFCELFLNGKYRGVYLAVETITAGKDGARLSLSVNKKNKSFSGYALRLDWGNSGGEKMIYPLTNYTMRAQSQHEIVYPGKVNLSPELMLAIKNDFSAFEKVLYSYDFDSNDYGYEKYIDTDSFVDYFLINELCCNVDAGIYSTYIYKDIDGKYRMCVWDFNSACDNYQEAPVQTDGVLMQYGLWYEMLFKDQEFTERVIRRYHELRDTYFSREYLFDFIDSSAAYLGDAAARNYALWGEYKLLLPHERNPENYEASIEQIKLFLSKRISFLDENIEMLRQYSAESKIKKYNEIAN